MKKYWLLSVLIYFYIGLCGQIPPGYYNAAGGLSGEELQSALHDIIKDHEVEAYSNLWEDFELTDKKPNGTVWDIYSDVPGGTPPYIYYFIVDQCGNYTQEGDCYNREHSFPKSWFGGNIYPMYSDLFHIYPTDGFVNGKRGNLPYGETGAASWTSLNGSKLGNCTYPGYSDEVFEIIDEFKGDIARTYFYMATRYYDEDNSWPGSTMVNGSQLKTWALNMLWEWHGNDPVSEKEINRNNAVYLIQDNRNPFIDHPEFVETVWFSTGVSEPSRPSKDNFNVFPNPVKEVCTIDYCGDYPLENINISVSDLSGRKVDAAVSGNNSSFKINTSGLPFGIYLIKISSEKYFVNYNFKLVK